MSWTGRAELGRGEHAKPHRLGNALTARRTSGETDRGGAGEAAEVRGRTRCAVGERLRSHDDVGSLVRRTSLRVPTLLRTAMARVCCLTYAAASLTRVLAVSAIYSLPGTLERKPISL